MSLENIFPNKEQFDTMNMLLASIASNTGAGIKVRNFKDIQTIVRAGLASKVFAIGDQIEIEKASTANAKVGEGSTGVTAVTVDVQKISAALSEAGHAIAGSFELVYDGVNWKNEGGGTVNLANWGITTTGTAKEGDSIIITVSATNLVFDVIGIDHDTPSDSQFTHSLTLGLHDCYTSLQFDATEALFYCEAELPAGTYNFTLLSGYDTTYGGGKSYYFTLTKAVPAGGQIMFPWGYNKQAVDTKVSTYESRTSTTALESGISVAEGTEGTPLTDIGECNHSHRIRYGSNNWVQSAMRQWLNSSATKGNVWEPQTNYDRPPSWVSNTDGFLYGIDKSFLDVIGEVKKITTLNTITDNTDGAYVETDEKFFLLSNDEAYFPTESGVKQGTPYAYYKNYSDHSAPSNNADSNRIKYRNGSATYWWLRSPNPWSAYNVRGVSPPGNLYDTGASDSYGVAPACCIV